MKIMSRKHKAQGMVEYAVILGVIALAIMSMQVYFKRGIQSVIKVVADDYSPYGRQGEGELVGDLEQAVKHKIFVQDAHIPTSSTSVSSMAQKIINTGNSNIRSEMSGSTTTNTESYAIGGDYSRRQ